MENDIESNDVQTQTESTTFSQQQHKRQRNRWRLQSSDYSSRDEASSSAAENALCPLLLSLRVLSYHRIHIFTVERGRKWNMRQDLGDGSTFSVKEADLPITYALSDMQYIDFYKSSREYFTDHTQTKWKHDTVVAYKSLVSGKDRNLIMTDLVTELRVLCHPPLQKHPNILRLLGAAWIREEDMASDLKETISEYRDVETREWPVLVTEKATFGSLFKFLNSREYRSIRSSLSAKLNLCIDALNGIMVRRAILTRISSR
jgi:hypothetical protein